jgi:hypothetical protein
LIVFACLYRQAEARCYSWANRQYMPPKLQLYLEASCGPARLDQTDRSEKQLALRRIRSNSTLLTCGILGFKESSFCR